MAAHQNRESFDEEFTVPLFPSSSSSSSDLSDDEEKPCASDDGSILSLSECKSTSFLILLTISMGGLQIVYSVLYSHGPTHLRSLGLDKSQTAITFIAGPLSGIFVQPLFGLWSDRCRLSWGRRRPFIALGGITLILSLLGLAWTKSLIRMIFTIPVFSSGSQYAHDHRYATTAMANVLTFCLYFAIQPIQACVRALIVDTCPTHQQQDANAWISCISGIGSVLGYLSAFIDLSRYLSYFGDTQFKNLSVLASLTLAVTLSLTCVCIVESDPRLTEVMGLEENSDDKLEVADSRSLKLVSEICSEVARMPKQVVNICLVQGFAWVAWYPYLLYATTYVGEIYVAETSVLTIYPSDGKYTAVWEDAARVGSLALLISSITSLIASILLPYLTQSSFSNSLSTNREAVYHQFPRNMTISWLTMRRLWIISHGLFALSMLTTIFVSSVIGTVTIFAITGIAWTVISWVPYTLLSLEVSQNRSHHSDSSRPEVWVDGHATLRPGIVFGLYSIAICIPQILISLGSSFIWKSQSDASQHDPKNTGWVLRAGGVAALVAMCLMWRIQEPRPRQEIISYHGIRRV